MAASIPVHDLSLACQTVFGQTPKIEQQDGRILVEGQVYVYPAKVPLHRIGPRADVVEGFILARPVKAYTPEEEGCVEEVGRYTSSSDLISAVVSTLAQQRAQQALEDATLARYYGQD